MKRLLLFSFLALAVSGVRAQEKFLDTRDGNMYATVVIDGKIWMAENLRFIPGEGFGYSENDPKNSSHYGVLYNWKSAMAACPDGWRLPTGKEYKELIDRTDDIKFWTSKSEVKGAFGIRMAGMQDYEGTYTERDESAYLWTSTEYDSENAEYFSYLELTENKVVDVSRKEDISDVHGSEKSNKYSVRCVKAELPQTKKQ
jgi:uncharacterized protein (TIGR02145 family)